MLFYVLILTVGAVYVALVTVLTYRRRQPNSTSRPAKIMAAGVFVTIMAFAFLISLGFGNQQASCLALAFVPATIWAYVTYSSIESASAEHINRTAQMYAKVFMFFERLLKRLLRKR